MGASVLRRLELVANRRLIACSPAVVTLDGSLHGTCEPIRRLLKNSLHPQWLRSPAQTSTPKMTARSVPVVSENRAARRLRSGRAPGTLRSHNNRIRTRVITSLGLAACRRGHFLLGEIA